MFQEYPKALYNAGQQLVVDNAEQEDAARESGYLDWPDDHARLNEPDAHAETPGVPALDRDALKAKAAELGLHFAPNIKTDKLAELVANHNA